MAGFKKAAQPGSLGHFRKQNSLPLISSFLHYSLPYNITMGQGGYRQINKTLNVDAFKDYLDSQQTHIPKMDDVTNLSPRVIRILGQNPGRVNNSFPAWTGVFFPAETSF